MIRVGFVSVKDSADKHAWSGTVSQFYNKMREEPDLHVVPIMIPTSGAVHLILKCYRGWFRLLKKTGYQPNASLGYARYKSWQLKRRLNKGTDAIDCLFVPAGNYLFAYLDTEIPIIYMSDATFHLLVDYYLFHLTPEQTQKGNRIEKKALERASAVIYSSQWAKEDVQGFYGLPDDRVRVIPFAPNMEPVPPCEHSIEGKNVIWCLLIGVDWERKGISCAINAMKELNSRGGKRYVLTVVGLSKPEGFQEDYVFFEGRLDKGNREDYARLNSLYCQSDFFLLPTRAECSAVVFSEASMYGLPVITYRTGGVSTYVKDGVNGYCLPADSSPMAFADKIFEITQCPDHYRRLSEGARRRYEETLNWPHYMKQLKETISLALSDQADGSEE